MKPPILFAAIVWAFVWASQCSADRPKDVGAIGPDPLLMQIEKINREHAEGRAVFQAMQKELADSRRRTDSVVYVIRTIVEQREIDRLIKESYVRPVRTDTPPCKPVPCFTAPDTTRLFVPGPKQKR